MNAAARAGAEIRALFAERGSRAYFGEPVTQLDHALQTAWLAERSGASSALIVAALCHDVGHLLHAHGEACADEGVDSHHEALGGKFLGERFGREVAEPVALHVAAKRFLCAKSRDYARSLSQASRASLDLQGGPMSPWEAERFANKPFAGDAVALRRWDDAAKAVGLATPSLDHFLRHVDECLPSRLAAHG
ncbi:MAG: HD domain-containing protein [bacterium]